MLRYLLQRTLWAIPAVLVVALFVLLIGELAPQDWVATKLEGSTGRFSDYNTTEAREALYREIRQEFGLDLPVFYLSIRSLSEPDTLHTLYPAARKELTENIIYEYGNWQEAVWYSGLVSRTESAALAYPAISSLITPLYTWQSASVAKRQWRTLYDYQDISPDIKAMAREALRTLDLMPRSASLWRNYIPVISWNGTENRYHLWLTSLLKGDFGKSFRDGESVNSKITYAIGQTLWITIPALLFTFVLSVWLGKVLSRSTFSIPSNLTSTSLYMLDAMPLFWLCLLLIMALVTLNLYELLPFYEITYYDTDSASDFAFSRMRQLIFPVLCLVLSSMPYVTKQVESALKEVYPQDYIMTARAKGLTEGKVIWKHAFRNAVFPLITLISLFLPAVFAGSLVVEALFVIPGIGKLLTDSVIARDYPVVMGIVFYMALIRIGANILADIAYFASDPRIRLKG